MSAYQDPNGTGRYIGGSHHPLAKGGHGPSVYRIYSCGFLSGPFWTDTHPVYPLEEYRHREHHRFTRTAGNTCKIRIQTIKN